MSNHRHPHSELIDLVSTTHVRNTFGISAQHLNLWRLRGIPVKRRVDFARLAARHKVIVPDDFLADIGLTVADVIGRAA